MQISLIGTWATDPDDAAALRELGQVEMVFRPDGSLDYVLFEDGKKQIMKLVWTVDGDVLVTDQPSAPRIERTPFELIDHDTLVLGSGDGGHRFKRKRDAPL